MQDEKKEIAAVHVERTEDGTIEATTVTKEGKVGTGFSTNGLLSPASTEDAVKESVKDAQSQGSSSE